MLYSTGWCGLESAPACGVVLLSVYGLDLFRSLAQRLFRRKLVCYGLIYPKPEDILDPAVFGHAGPMNSLSIVRSHGIF